MHHGIDLNLRGDYDSTSVILEKAVAALQNHRYSRISSWFHALFGESVPRT